MSEARTQSKPSLRLGGVRLRAALAAALVVAVALAAGAVAFVLLQRHQLTSSLEDVARQQASDVAARVRVDGADADADVLGGGGDQSLIQVVARGQVRVSSASIDGEPPVSSLSPPPGRVDVVTTDRLPIGEGALFVVVAEGAESPDGPIVVLTAQSLETVQESTSVVIWLLALGCPLVVLLVGLTSYWLTGRALAPVEAIRRRVAAIGGTNELAARVPVPRTGDEIARLAETMNAMLARLETGAKAQRRFVGDASHELRSPLSTIRAIHEISNRYPSGADWPTASAEVLSELDRVERLVTDMLLLARADEHGLSLRHEDVDLDDLVRDESDRLRRSGTLQVVIMAPPVQVRGDHHQLSRALRNLADNAARHAVTRVDLRLSTHEDTAVIEVTDDGPGIGLDDRDRVFQRFVRLDESRARDGGGTGLGLPIARQIARAHGGELHVAESHVGARLVLSLPIKAL